MFDTTSNHGSPNNKTTAGLGKSSVRVSFLNRYVVAA